MFDHTYPLSNYSNHSLLTYDWRGGHIFTASQPGFQIELTTINGNMIGSVLDFQAESKRYVLNLLGQLLYDEKQRYCL